MVNRYLDALVAHDPTKIPTTPDVRFVENGVALPLGSALWKTASGRGTYTHYFADVAAGQAGFIGTMREHGKGLILVLRLAVANGQIREIEQLAIRTGQVDEYEKLTPDPLWTTAVPEAARSSRSGTDRAGGPLLQRHAAQRSQGRLHVLPQGVQPGRARASDDQHAALELRPLRHPELRDHGV